MRRQRRADRSQPQVGDRYLIVLPGTALVDGIDIREDMDSVYARMGVCPQHDQLWDQLTAREHLLFYGRLKNLKVQLPASVD